jgi:hypothetical protein
MSGRRGHSIHNVFAAIRRFGKQRGLTFKNNEVFRGLCLNALQLPYEYPGDELSQHEAALRCRIAQQASASRLQLTLELGMHMAHRHKLTQAIDDVAETGLCSAALVAFMKSTAWAANSARHKPWKKGDQSKIEPNLGNNCADCSSASTSTARDDCQNFLNNMIDKAKSQSAYGINVTAFEYIPLSATPACLNHWHVPDRLEDQGDLVERAFNHGLQAACMDHGRSSDLCVSGASCVSDARMDNAFMQIDSVVTSGAGFSSQQHFDCVAAVKLQSRFRIILAQRRAAKLRDMVLLRLNAAIRIQARFRGIRCRASFPYPSYSVGMVVMTPDNKSPMLFGRVLKRKWSLAGDWAYLVRWHRFRAPDRNEWCLQHRIVKFSRVLHLN